MSSFVPYHEVVNHYSAEVDLDQYADLEVAVTPKLDGTNINFWRDESGTVQVGSHRRHLELGEENAGSQMLLLTHEPTQEMIKNLTRVGHRVYGELMVKHTVSTYFDWVWHNVFIYDIRNPDGTKMPTGDLLPFVIDRSFPEARLFTLPYCPMPLAKAIDRYAQGGSLPGYDEAAYGINPKKDVEYKTWEGVVLHHPDLRKRNGESCAVKIVNPLYRERNRQEGHERTLAMKIGCTPFDQLIQELVTPERIAHRFHAMGGISAFTDHKDCHLRLSKNLLADLMKEEFFNSLEPIIDLQIEMAPQVRAGQKGTRVPELPTIKTGSAFRAVKQIVYSWLSENARFPELGDTEDLPF